ncbi:hypothetical protein T492DRAFT_1130517, partial [Pavlovales sp. CCMP2436]
MKPQLAAAAAAVRTLFAFLFIARFKFEAQSIYFHNDSTQICTRLQLDISDGLDLRLSETVIMHSRDPMPTCNDDAWTLAGLDSLDANDRVVDMGIYSHATMDEGRMQLHFEDGDLSDGCKDFRSTTINLVVARISDGSTADVHEHYCKLTWTGASNPDCHTEFELKVPRDIGEDKDYFEKEEQLMLDQLLAPRGIGEAEAYFDDDEEQFMLDQLLGPRGIGDAEHYFDEEDDGDYDFKNYINNYDQLMRHLLDKQGLAQAIRQKVGSATLHTSFVWVMPIEDSTTEKAAVAWVAAPPPPPYPLVAAIRALLLPAMVVPGILLLAAAWCRGSTNSKTALRTDLLPLQVERSKVADWRLV